MVIVTHKLQSTFATAGIIPSLEASERTPAALHSQRRPTHSCSIAHDRALVHCSADEAQDASP